MNTPTKENLTTLLGGADVTVTTTDGTQQTVKVRQMRVRDFPLYLQAISSQDEVRQVEVLCDQAAGWGEKLTPSSHELVITTGEEINGDFFSRWLGRRKKREALVPKPDMGEIVQVLDVMSRSNPALLDDLLKRATSAASPNSSPTSPSGAA